MRTAEQDRERAALCRRLAETVVDPALREQLETAASDYDAFADELEGKNSGIPPQP